MKCVCCPRRNASVQITTKAENALPVGVAICPDCRAAIARREVGIVRADDGALHITDGRTHAEKLARR